ncbi:MAG: hypothetical protein BIFFINMI_02554 [Phycisphaerae bacterium]|nr:hypothetical protein [Phycisphaerae bacterium]
MMRAWRAVFLTLWLAYCVLILRSRWSLQPWSVSLLLAFVFLAAVGAWMMYWPRFREWIEPLARPGRRLGKWTQPFVPLLVAVLILAVSAGVFFEVESWFERLIVLIAPLLALGILALGVRDVRRRRTASEAEKGNDEAGMPRAE